MTEEKKITEKEFHHKYAAGLFNHVWSFLDKKERTAEEDMEMIHCAHASVYHWSKIGTPNNLYVGEWQISRVYAVLNHAQEALYHAKRALELCQQNDDFSPFDWAYAYEAMARAYMIADNKVEWKKYLKKAKEKGEEITDEESKKMLFDDLNGLEA